MARGWFGQRIPDRLRLWPTPDELARMVRHPAAFAPTAAEVLAPQTSPSRTLPALKDFGARDLVTRAGAVIGLSLTGRSFVAHSDALFAIAPALAEVRFVAVRHILSEFTRGTNLARLRTINLAGNRIGLAGAQVLAACEYFHSLHALDLTANSVGDDGGRALSDAPWAESIAELRLSASELSADGVRALRDRFGNRLLLA